MPFKVNITEEHRYNCESIIYEKEFTIPFAPFYELILIEEDEDGREHEIELRNNDYNKTQIYYNITNDTHYIRIMNYWSHPVTDETVDNVVLNAERFGWKKIGDIDTEKLKTRMKQDYERRNNR